VPDDDPYGLDDIDIEQLMVDDPEEARRYLELVQRGELMISEALAEGMPPLPSYRLKTLAS